MKTILKLSLVCALLFSGAVTYAIDGDAKSKEDFRLHVMKKEGNYIIFSLNKVKAAKVSIYEKDGSLIYSERAKGNEEGILRAFSLQGFPNGTYLLEIENDTKKIIHEITVKDNRTFLSTAAVSEKYKDNFNTNNSSVASR